MTAILRPSFFIVFALGIALAYSVASEIPEYKECRFLQVRGVHTTGTITELTLSQHNTFRFAYTANGIKYYETGALDRIIRAAFVGKSLGVVYDPLNPSISRTGKSDLEDCYANHIVPIILVAIVSALMVILFIVDTAMLRFSRRRRQSSVSKR